MTGEQERARELIALIEGTNLTCERDGDNYVITSELGAIYTVDRFGERIWRNGWTRPRTLTDLEMDADAPMWNPADSPELPELESYAGPLTDEYTEARLDREAERRRVIADLSHYRNQERRAA